MSDLDFSRFKNRIPTKILKITKEINTAGGELYIVGGWPRDMILGAQTSDFDFEVYGLSFEQLEKILSKFGKANLVGKAFGVINLRMETFTLDFALPRTESKCGVSHRDFKVKPDSDLSFKAASQRRDFTLNSMGVKLPCMTLEDPNGGMQDIKRKVIRHVSDSFSDDPLRVLRAVQFAARFEFDIAEETITECRKLSLAHLSKERIFGEFKKLLLKSKKPSIGLQYMREIGVLSFFPELEALINLEQDHLWHPEGDVWAHNQLVIDEEVKLLTGNEKEDVILMLAALCHDFGKATTTQKVDGRARSPLHEAAGVPLSKTFLERITDEKEIFASVAALVNDHMKPHQLFDDRSTVTDAAIRRLSLRVDIKKLVKLSEADWRGKGLDRNRGEYEPGKWLTQKAKELVVLDSKPIPLLTGKILMDLGVSEGPEMGELIKESFEVQIEGGIQNKHEAISWAKQKLGIN